MLSGIFTIGSKNEDVLRDGFLFPVYFAHFVTFFLNYISVPETCFEILWLK